MIITLAPVPTTDTVRIKRLTQFAADAAELADRRCDAELCNLIASLHADLLALRGDND